MPPKIALPCLVIPTSDRFRHASRKDGVEKTVFLAFAGFHVYVPKLDFTIFVKTTLHVLCSGVVFKICKLLKLFVLN